MPVSAGHAAVAIDLEVREHRNSAANPPATPPFRSETAILIPLSGRYGPPITPN